MGSGMGRGGQGVEDREQEGLVHEAAYTTVQLRNIPAAFSKQDVETMLDSHGCALLYDFIYLPVCFKTQLTLGHVFLNFCSSEDAAMFLTHFSGFQDLPSSWQSKAVAQWSDSCQGVDNLIKLYRNSPVMHPEVADDWKPQLYRDGARVPFPGPTVRLKKPRIRNNSSKRSRLIYDLDKFCDL